MEIINFRGDLTDNSAKKEALVETTALPLMRAYEDLGPSGTVKETPLTARNCNYEVRLAAGVYTSVAVLAEIPLRSPQKLFIFIIKIYIFWLKVSKNKII